MIVTRRAGLLVGLLLALAVGHFAGNLWVLLDQPSATDMAPVDTGLSPLAARVVLIVVDALPVRVAYDPASMPSLSALAPRGAHGILRTPPESNTAAGVMALGTGGATDAADLLGLFYSFETRGWTVFDDIIERGGSVGFTGARAWSSVFAWRDPATAREAGDSTWGYLSTDASFETALAKMDAADSVTLTVVHVNESDHLSHLYGTLDPRYQEGMRDIDTAIRRFRERILDGSTTFILTSDHGNDINGDHGGSADIYREVPVVMHGAGVRSGLKFSMDARAMPGVLATLLGLRLPAMVQATIPTEAFELNERQRGRLVLANARQLEAMAQTLWGDLPAALSDRLARLAKLFDAGRYAEQIALAEETLPALLHHLEVQTPPSPERLLWVAALFLSIVIAALHLAAPADDSVLIDRLLGAAIAVALLRVLLPIAGAACVALLVILEIALVVRLATRASLATQTAVPACIGVAALGVVVAGVRFARMPAIKDYVSHLPIEQALLGLGLASAGAWIARAKWAWIARRAHDSSLALGAAFALALVLLQPFSAVPVIIIGVAVLALLAAGRSPATVACAVLLLAAWFFVSGRFVFAWTGEDPVTRYAYAVTALACVATLLVLATRRQRLGLGLAIAALAALWPFGYFKILSHYPTTVQTALAVGLSLGVVALWALHRGARPLALLPLGATAAYFAFPGDTMFLAGLTIHLGTLALLAARPGERREQRCVTAVTALSAIALMSRVYDVPSLPVLPAGAVPGQPRGSRTSARAAARAGRRRNRRFRQIRIRRSVQPPAEDALRAQQPRSRLGIPRPRRRVAGVRRGTRGAQDATCLGGRLRGGCLRTDPRARERRTGRLDGTGHRVSSAWLAAGSPVVRRAVLSAEHEPQRQCLSYRTADRVGGRFRPLPPTLPPPYRSDHRTRDDRRIISLG